MHHLLFIFFQFRGKCDIKVRQPPSYTSKLCKPWVLETINNRKSFVERYSDLVNDAFLNYRVDISPSWDPFSQQESEDVENELCGIELDEQAKRGCESDDNSK